MLGLTRRSFLLGSGAAAALAACGGDDGGGDATPTTARQATSTTAAAGVVLGVTFDRNGLLVAGIEQRAPFLLFRPDGGLVPIDEAPEELTIEFTAESGSAPAPLAVARHGADVDRAYYPAVATFTATGLHTARITVGDDVLDYPFNVNDPADVAVPQVGEPLPAATTPTNADPLGVETICTADPPCPFHEVSLDAALTEGRPVALLVSTPAYCQVGICGPVLDLLIGAAPAHPDPAFIHLEVYPNGAPPAAPPSPLLAEPLGLSYEPVLFVADTAGALTARLDNIYDSVELDAALRSAR